MDFRFGCGLNDSTNVLFRQPDFGRLDWRSAATWSVPGLASWRDYPMFWAKSQGFLDRTSLEKSWHDLLMAATLSVGFGSAGGCAGFCCTHTIGGRAMIRQGDGL